MSQFRTSRTFDVLFVLILLSALGFAYLNRTAINDRIFFATHQPTSRAQEIASLAALSPTGTQLLHRGNPQFVAIDVVNAVCEIERLGCLTETGQIYVLDDPKNPEQTMVTAAHEMLHLAYRRLSEAEKAALAPALRAGIEQHANAGLADDINDLTEEADRLDEAHSLLGTEYQNIPADLETHFSQYFSDRDKVVLAQKRQN